MEYPRDASPTLREMLLSISPLKREEFWREVEGALRVYESPAGFVAPDEVLVAAGSA